jgi:hypothetical protein
MVESKSHDNSTSSSFLHHHLLRMDVWSDGHQNRTMISVSYKRIYLGGVRLVIRPRPTKKLQMQRNAQPCATRLLSDFASIQNKGILFSSSCVLVV